MNTVHVMSQTLRIVVVNCGYDIMYNAFDGRHTPPVVCYIVGVMS